MFYSCLTVLATVASAPVDNYGTIGTGSDNTLCDFSKGDCSLFQNNGYAISSADFPASPDGAGVEGSSAFLNLVTTTNSASSEEDGFDTKSDFTPDLFEQWIASGPGIVEIAGAPLSNTATAPARSSVTYDCENPFHNHGHQPTVDISFDSIASKKPSDGKKLPAGSAALSCTKCLGPDDGACKSMFAECVNVNKPYQCTLCFTDGSLTCESIDNISRLPSPENQYGQSWCYTQECRGGNPKPLNPPCPFGLPHCVSL